MKLFKDVFSIKIYMPKCPLYIMHASKLTL